MSSVVTNKLSFYLSKYLKEHKMLQKDFAKLIGVQPNTLSQWVNGKRQPDSSTLILLAQTFGITVDELLGSDSTTERRKPTDKEIQYALFGEEVSEELYNKAKEFAKFLITYKMSEEEDKK